MNTLNFIFNDSQLNIYGTVDEPVFVVNEICDVLNISRRSRLIDNTLKNPKYCHASLAQDNLPLVRGKEQAIINERGLYEIMFRSNSSIAEQFKDEIYTWLKDQRIQQNLIKNEQIKQLEDAIKQKDEIIDQQNEQLHDINAELLDRNQEVYEKTEQIAEKDEQIVEKDEQIVEKDEQIVQCQASARRNRRRALDLQQQLFEEQNVYEVVTIYKVVNGAIDRNRPQIICVSKNSQSIVNSYAAKLDKYYNQECEYTYQTDGMGGQTRQDAIELKREMIQRLVNYRRVQHRTTSDVRPLYNVE